MNRCPHCGLWPLDERMRADHAVAQLADGLALWEEHRPRTAEDWVAVAERFIAAGDDTSNSSPMFAALVLAVKQRDAVRGKETP